MDVRRLAQFLAVAETLHFGRAAARLCMTQPPLSQSIRALEDELGMPLFVRTKRRVALTPFGAEWLPHVRMALEGVGALANIARRIRDGEAGRLEVSFVTTADYGPLPELVRRFRQTHPDVELILTEATSDVQMAELLDGRGHAGIVIAHGRAPLPSTLSYRKLVSEPIMAAVPAEWVRQGRLEPVNGRLSPAALVSCPLIVFPRRAAPLFYDLVIDYWGASGGQARIAQHAIQMQTIISLVSAGMGVAIVPSSLRNLVRAGVCYLDLQGEVPELETGIVWRSEDATPTLRNFLELATNLLASTEK